jgi:hypothetical protein
MTWVSCRSVVGTLVEKHYLGAIDRGVAWQDEFGVIVVAAPTARHLPQNWLELVRWCLIRNEKNDGSRQWAIFVRALKKANSKATTIVSYSDPSRGHSGALYRACNWYWAPTWHRLRPPPTGNGSWGDKKESVKDRWIFSLRPDPVRIKVLTVKDESILRRWPNLKYREPGGVSYKQWQHADRI